MAQPYANVGEEEKSRAPPPSRFLSPAYLAQSTDNCQDDEVYREKLAAAIFSSGQQLRKERLLKQWRSGPIEAIDFWWEPKAARSLEQFINDFNSQDRFNSNAPETLRYFNDLVADAFPASQYYLVPYFAAECFRQKPLVVERATTPLASLPSNWGPRCYQAALQENKLPPITISPSTYMCVNPFYTEYAMSLIFSDYYTTKKSIHFVSVEADSFSTCLTPNEESKETVQPSITIKELFVMKRVEGHPLYDVAHPSKRPLPSNSQKYQNACLIQVLHSIALYQQEGVSHNDLHGGNILLEQVLLSTRWKDHQLIDYDYFQYKLKGRKSLYVPFVPFVSKIIDFGLSCKYASPLILNKRIMEGGYGASVSLKSNPGQTHRIQIPPNWFFPAYDVFTFLLNFCLILFPGNLLAQQLLWIALHFPNKDVELPSEKDARAFYSQYNEAGVHCIIGFNPDHSQSKLQIVLEDNVIASYKNLNALALLEKCLEETSALAPYADPPGASAKCGVLGSLR